MNYAPVGAMSKGFSQCGGRFLPINSFPQILNGEQEKSAMTYRLLLIVNAPRPRDNHIHDHYQYTFQRAVCRDT